MISVIWFNHEFCVFRGVLSENTNGKKNSSPEGVLPYFVLYHCDKEIKNFEKHPNFLSDMHQNLINTKLYQGTTECKKFIKLRALVF